MSWMGGGEGGGGMGGMMGPLSGLLGGGGGQAAPQGPSNGDLQRLEAERRLRETAMATANEQYQRPRQTWAETLQQVGAALSEGPTAAAQIRESQDARHRRQWEQQQQTRRREAAVTGVERVLEGERRRWRPEQGDFETSPVMQLARLSQSPEQFLEIYTRRMEQTEARDFTREGWGRDDRRFDAELGLRRDEFGETQRRNQAVEGLAGREAAEAARHNRASEGIGWMNAQTSRMSTEADATARTAPRPPTEAQQRAGLNAARMAEAERFFTRQGRDGREYLKPSVGSLFGAGGMNLGTPNEESRNLHQAALRWSDSLLRMTSGAEAPEAEVRRAIAAYLPQSTDSPANLAAKAEARAVVMAGIDALARGGQAPGANAIVEMLQRNRAAQVFRQGGAAPGTAGGAASQPPAPPPGFTLRRY